MGVHAVGRKPGQHGPFFFLYPVVLYVDQSFADGFIDLCAIIHEIKRFASHSQLCLRFFRRWSCSLASTRMMSLPMRTMQPQGST